MFLGKTLFLEKYRSPSLKPFIIFYLLSRNFESLYLDNNRSIVHQDETKAPSCFLHGKNQTFIRLTSSVSNEPIKARSHHAWNSHSKRFDFCYDKVDEQSLASCRWVRFVIRQRSSLDQTGKTKGCHRWYKTRVRDPRSHPLDRASCSSTSLHPHPSYIYIYLQPVLKYDRGPRIHRGCQLPLMVIPWKWTLLRECRESRGRHQLFSLPSMLFGGRQRRENADSTLCRRRFPPYNETNRDIPSPGSPFFPSLPPSSRQFVSLRRLFFLFFFFFFFSFRIAVGGWSRPLKADRSNAWVVSRERPIVAW